MAEGMKRSQKERKVLAETNPRWEVKRQSTEEPRRNHNHGEQSETPKGQHYYDKPHNMIYQPHYSSCDATEVTPIT